VIEVYAKWAQPFKNKPKFLVHHQICILIVMNLRPPASSEILGTAGESEVPKTE